MMYNYALRGSVFFCESVEGMDSFFNTKETVCTDHKYSVNLPQVPEQSYCPQPVATVRCST